MQVNVAPSIQTSKPWLEGLREYQIDARRKIIQAWIDGNRSVLLRLCTGAGKSVIIRSICLEVFLKGKKILVVSHDSRILTQLHGHALEVGIPQDQVGILKAWKSGEFKLELHKPVQVAMIQSLSGSWNELQEGLFKLEPDLIIIDEAHHSSATTNYFQLWERFPQAKILGVTATPARPGGQGFYYPQKKGEPKRYLFDVLIEGIDKRSLINMGFLPECETYFGLTPSLKGVAKRKGEFVVEGEDGLASRFDNADIRGDIIRAWREFVYVRFGAAPTVCFGVSVNHIINIAAEFQHNGIPAVALYGGLSKIEQNEALRSFITGESVILTLCGMGQEGFDLSSLAKSMGLKAESVFCCIKALATASLTKNSQLDGRVRGIDLMKWDWRELPVPANPNMSDGQPKKDDAVLGTSSRLLQGSLVLGGKEGTKALLDSFNIAARIAGVKRCIESDNFDLLLQYSKDPHPQLRSLIETVLENKELAKQKKLLYGIIIDCGNNLERHGCYDDEHIWTLDGVKPKPSACKSCPHCKLETVAKNAAECPNCGYRFVDELIRRLGAEGESTGEGRTIRHRKDAEMALLDREAWNTWKNIKKRHWNDYAALREFGRKNPSIPDFYKAGIDCKNKDGVPYQGYSVYKIWVANQREMRGNSFKPSFSQLQEWRKVAKFKRGWERHELQRLAKPQLEEIPT